LNQGSGVAWRAPVVINRPKVPLPVHQSGPDAQQCERPQCDRASSRRTAGVRCDAVHTLAARRTAGEPPTLQSVTGIRGPAGWYQAPPALSFLLSLGQCSTLYGRMPASWLKLAGRRGTVRHALRYPPIAANIHSGVNDLSAGGGMKRKELPCPTPSSGTAGCLFDPADGRNAVDLFVVLELTAK
jgi:hypothetical protein